MDRLTPQQRHANMSAIRARNTKPEMIVRKYLFAHGYRYRLQEKRLPGKPDIVMRRLHTVILVNGCFWHGHKLIDNGQLIIDNSGLKIDNGQLTIDSSPCCKIPKTNREFWVQKIVRNMQRDLQVRQQLKEKGWNVIQIWECQLKPACRQATLQSLLLTLSHIELKMAGCKMEDG
jgi:DNA mismatch endonuclease (patch repair protein)